jgi:hypothetical protein
VVVFGAKHYMGLLSLLQKANKGYKEESN